MKYAVVPALVLLSFATLVTAHVAICARLVWRVRPWYRGIAAFFVAPLAPWWAFEQGWRKSGLVWIGAVLAYVVGLVLASF